MSINENTVVVQYAASSTDSLAPRKYAHILDGFNIFGGGYVTFCGEIIPHSARISIPADRVGSRFEPCVMCCETLNSLLTTEFKPLTVSSLLDEVDTILEAMNKN